jgi:Holliday junction resolvasome RuvABC endonuclease subunit
MRLITIDSSTRRTGIALFENGVYQTHVLVDLSSSKADTDERINLMIDAMILILDDMRPDAVVIEEPKGHAKVELLRKLSEILGAIRGWCIINKIEYHEIKPSVWRKYCGISQGKKKREELKEESINLVKEKYGMTVSDDEADSICIGIATINIQGL